MMTVARYVPIRAFLAGPAILVSLACHGDTHIDSSGTEAYEDLTSAEEVEIRMEWRIDGNEFDLVPVRPEAVSAGPYDQIAVGQPLDHRVLLLDATGRIAAALGHRGSGPGEFMHVGRLGWFADTLWVWDDRLQRATLVNADHEIVEAVTARVGPSALESEGAVSFIPYAAVSFLSRDTLLVYGSMRETQSADVIVRATSAGNPVGLIALISTAEDLRTIALPGGGVMDGDPFLTAPRFAVAHDAQHIATYRVSFDNGPGGVFTVSLITVDGDTVFHRGYRFMGTPISRHVRDSIFARAAASLPPEQVSLYRRQAYIPPVHPPVSGILVTSDPSVWLQLHSDSERPYMVLDQNGDPVMRVSFPQSATVVAAKGTAVWALEADTTGVQSIVRYRLSR